MHDIQRRIADLEDAVEVQQEFTQEIRLSLRSIETQMSTIASALRWGIILLGVAASLTSGILWLINHSR